MCYHMVLEAPSVARAIKPGQFIHVRCSDSFEPLLRRPFSLHRKNGGRIEILYKVVGSGTEILSRRQSGEAVDVLGPLGNGFAPKLSTLNSQLSTILVAGGMGVAPLVALAQELSKKKTQKLRVLIGACSKSRILCEEEFRALGAEVSISTEDGSKGAKGLITDRLNFLLSTLNSQLSTIYACGPNAMLKALSRIANAKRIPCQVSLEERMACGVGACLGCPVKVKAGEYKMVCKDGPVFDAEEIAW